MDATEAPKPPPDRLRLSVLDLAILLFHVHRGTEIEQVGFEDCERTLQQLTAALEPKRVFVPRECVESALWSANLMDEVGEFWHPQGTGFDKWVRKILAHSLSEMHLQFSRTYNRITVKPPSLDETKPSALPKVSVE